MEVPETLHHRGRQDRPIRQLQRVFESTDQNTEGEISSAEAVKADLQWWIVGGSFPGWMERALPIPPTLIESNHLDSLLEHTGATPVVGNFEN